MLHLLPRLSLQILSNFGVDVLEALSSTCTLFTRHSIGLGPLVSDLLVAFLLITAHGSVLMCQVGCHSYSYVVGIAACLLSWGSHRRGPGWLSAGWWLRELLCH
jgi:hypothetical protein